MEKRLLIYLILAILFFNLISAGTYGAGTYGAGDYNIGETSSITSSPSSSSGGGAATHYPSLVELKESYEKTLKVNDKIEFKFKEESHKLKLDKIIDDKTVQITISSEPITFNLSLNEVKNINLNNDSYYDLKVYLKGLTSFNADVVVKLISEEIPEDVSEEEKTVGSEVKETKDWGLAMKDLIFLGFLFVIFGIYLILKKKDLSIRMPVVVKNMRKR